jgi:HK97 family phage portal protein
MGVDGTKHIQRERNLENKLMGIFDRFKKIYTKQAPVIMYSNIGYSVNRKTSYEEFAREGYTQNSIVYRCINEISQAAASVPLCVYVNDEETEEHPLYYLLQKPNPLQAGVEYFQELYTNLLISGNAYELSVLSDQELPKEIYNLRPDRIKIISSGRAIPAGYDYVISGRTVEHYSVDSMNGYSQIKHHKLYNPLDDYYGISPIAAAANDIDQHNMSARHNVALLENGARPSGAIVFRPKDESGQSVQLTEAQRSQLISDLELRFTGKNNAGRAMLLEGDFDWKEMGLSPKDMDFMQLKNASARDIALCFGVPAQLVGIPDSQTYANMAEARLALYEETIIPLLRRIESDLSEWYSIAYGEDIYVEYDVDDIPAITERRKIVYDSVNAAVSAGIMTRNEARERLGLSEVDGGDQLLVPANLFPIGMTDTDTDLAPEDADKMAYGSKQVNTVPTDEMAKEAQRGLDWRREYNRGGTLVGVTRANQIVNKESLSENTIRRMVSYFARHEVDKEAEGFNQGEDGYPSAGRIAWALWGGDAGMEWANNKADEFDSEDEL